MKHDKSIFILKQARSPQLPLSWVPDFRDPRISDFPNGHFAASPRSRPVFRIVNQELHVLGISEIHIIASCLDPLPQNDSKEHASPSFLNEYKHLDFKVDESSLRKRVGVIRTIRDWAGRVLDSDEDQTNVSNPASQKQSQKSSRAKRLKTFRTALTLGSQDHDLHKGVFTWLSYILAGIDDICPLPKETERDRKYYGIHSSDPDFLGWISHWIFENHVWPHSEKLGSTHNFICQLLEGRIMIITDLGYIGITSPLVKPEDNIAIFSGLDVPMVVRATQQESRYKLIAPVYLQQGGFRYSG